MKDLVLVGGGHSNVAVLRHFAMRPVAGVRITLISRRRYTPYSGMLPGLIAGHYTFEDAHIDLQHLTRVAGASGLFDEAVALDPAARVVHCRERPPVRYDVLSINIGSTPNASVPGAAEHAIPVKPIDRFLDSWTSMRARVLTAGGRSMTIAVVGGGSGGVELLLSVRHSLCTGLRQEALNPGRLRFHLFSASPTILPTHNRRVRRIFERLLADRQVVVHAGAPVTAVEHETLHTADGHRHAADEILWTTQAKAAGWLRESGLDVDNDGFIRVLATLQSTSHADVFAAGDVAALAGTRLQKSGVYAVREGEVLAANLRRLARGEPLRAYTPQRQFLSLISTGDRHAVASRGPLAFQGAWVWHWKDRIDRRFVRMYNELSKPPQPMRSSPRTTNRRVVRRRHAAPRNGHLD